MSGLASERHLVPLDAERPQHDAEWEIHRLEYRPLLDVELQIGGRALQFATRFQGGVEIDVEARDRIGQRDALGILPPPQLVLVGHGARSGRGAEQRAAEARTLLVSPVDEPDGDWRRS